jgi:hypothetical protein
MRELSKDSAFIARESLREQLEKDTERFPTCPSVPSHPDSPSCVISTRSCQCSRARQTKRPASDARSRRASWSARVPGGLGGASAYGVHGELHSLFSGSNALASQSPKHYFKVKPERPPSQDHYGQIPQDELNRKPYFRSPKFLC